MADSPRKPALAAPPYGGRIEGLAARLRPATGANYVPPVDWNDSAERQSGDTEAAGAEGVLKVTGKANPE